MGVGKDPRENAYMESLQHLAKIHHPYLSPELEALFPELNIVKRISNPPESMTSSMSCILQ